MKERKAGSDEKGERAVAQSLADHGGGDFVLTVGGFSREVRGFVMLSEMIPCYCVENSLSGSKGRSKETRRKLLPSSILLEKPEKQQL